MTVAIQTKSVQEIFEEMTESYTPGRIPRRAYQLR